jgi:hypothetical protein
MSRIEQRRAAASVLSWLAVGCASTSFLCVFLVGINSHHLGLALGLSFGMAVVAIAAGLTAMIIDRRFKGAASKLVLPALALAVLSAASVVFVLVALSGTGE